MSPLNADAPRKVAGAAGLAALTGLQIACLLLVALAAPLSAETIKVHRPDFPLPEGLIEELPEGTTAEDVFVTDDLCFYVRKDGAFQFLNCIG